MPPLKKKGSLQKKTTRSTLEPTSKDLEERDSFQFTFPSSKINNSLQKKNEQPPKGTKRKAEDENKEIDLQDFNAESEDEDLLNLDWLSTKNSQKSLRR
jgi:hypothetical protein